MIGVIFDILRMSEWHGMSEEIEIAKGKNELTVSVKDNWKRIKRKRAWSQRR